MRDRIAAVGGTLTIDSAPGHGTRVQGSVPDPWLDATP
jgi:signal transduction histidine kinase